MFNFNKPKQDLDNAIKTCPTCLGSGQTSEFDVLGDKWVLVPCTNPDCPTKKISENVKKCPCDDELCLPKDCPSEFCSRKLIQQEEKSKKDSKVPLEYLEIDLAEELLEVGKVLGFASKKHNDRDGYKNKTVSEVLGRVYRHLNAFNRGIELDDESKCSHLAHAALCCLIALNIDNNSMKKELQKCLEKD